MIPTPIGNIADISVSALQALESCDEILCEDTRIAKKLIMLLNERHLLQKSRFTFTSFHSHNEDSRILQLNSDFFHKNIAFLSDAGTPCISDPGAKLVAFLQKNHIKYTAISGACSVSMAFSLSGFEGGFSFLGFIPHKLQNKKEFLQKMLRSSLHCICFESPKRILESLSLIANFAPKRDMFLAKELTKIYEKFYFGEAQKLLSELKTQNLNGEWVVIIKGTEQETQEKTLNKIDIQSLQIPPKIKAKLLSKLENKSIKECYDEILQSEQNDRQNMANKNNRQKR